MTLALTTTQVEFNLEDTIRLVVAQGVGPDPHDIATKVLELIPVGLERDLLARLLPQYCRKVTTGPRKARKYRLARATRSTDGMMTGKWALVREEILNDPFSVDGQWVVFGDLTQDNLAWLVADRKEGAADLTAEATRLSNLLSLMKREKVATVRNLPFDLIEKVML